MSDEVSFLTALGITLAASFLVIFYLRAPLRGILAHLCAADHWSSFWAAYSNLMLVLVPLAALLLAQGPHSPTDAVVSVIAQVRWSLTGLIIAVLVISFSLATPVWPSRPQMSLSSDQIDDLDRLLAKVEEIRAREVLSRAGTRN